MKRKRILNKILEIFAEIGIGIMMFFAGAGILWLFGRDPFSEQNIELAILIGALLFIVAIVVVYIIVYKVIKKPKKAEGEEEKNESNRAN